MVFIGSSGVCPPLLKDMTSLPMPRAGSRREGVGSGSQHITMLSEQAKI